MTPDLEALRELLRGQLCEDTDIVRRPDGALMVSTNFRFPDGDVFPMHLSQLESGELRLSDRGHTLMHISYGHDVDALVSGTQSPLLERVMGESGLKWGGKNNGALCLDTAPERLAESILAFGQGLTRVYDLALLVPSGQAS